ncbi:MAG: TRAFAC clade GTPase domain-containing protein [Planctomycetota bacterium]|jgi:hypothetical protein
MAEPETEEVTLPKYEDVGHDILRDRIVILGRQGAGKTVYLSLLYDLLWKSNDDLTMKALHGEHHREFIKTAVKLRHGKWPGPTASNRSAYIEISYKDQNRLMVAMDYSGELINKAFVSEEKSDEVQELLEHLDRAAGVILLVDPAHVVGPKANIDSTVENDFGIVQATSRLRKWAGGANIPIVLVLTKVDETQPLLREYGGTKAFVQKLFPKLISTVINLKVCKISAVQKIKNGTGKIKPGFVPTHLEVPLRYCLDKISESEKNAEMIKRHQQYVEANIKKIKHEIKRDRIIRWCLITVITVALGILVYYILTIVWPKIVDKWIFGS